MYRLIPWRNLSHVAPKYTNIIVRFVMATKARVMDSIPQIWQSLLETSPVRSSGSRRQTKRYFVSYQKEALRLANPS